MSRRGRNHAPPIRACAVCGCTDVTPCAMDGGGTCCWVTGRFAEGEDEPREKICSACVVDAIQNPRRIEELREGGYGSLANHLRHACSAWILAQPLVELATEGEMNALLRARKAGAS